MRRTLKLVSAIAAVLANASALALELGALHTESALNQPFLGYIELSDIKPDELDAVRIELAPPEAFEKARLERYYYLTQLRFIPESTPDGRVQVRVTSAEPMREPYLDFLVQAIWPKGRLTKSYTVLLDPPTQVERRAPSIQAARASAVSAAPAGRQAQTGVRSAPGAAPAGDYLPPPGEGFPVYIGPVSPGEGLWSLARRHAPAGATPAQTALALYRCNQSAFVRANINRLIAGKTLVIPSRAELFALDAETAWREFQAAMQGRPGARSPLTPVTPEMLAQLKVAGIVAPAQPMSAGPSSGQASPVPTAAMHQPSPEVLQAIETSESARQEAAEMRQRIQELEAQLAEIQDQLKRRDSELAQLQFLAQQPPPATGPQAVLGPESESPEPETPVAPPAAEPVESMGQPELVGTEASVQPAPVSPVEPSAEPAAIASPEGETEPAPGAALIPLPEVESRPPAQPAEPEPPKTAAPPQPVLVPEPQPQIPQDSIWHDLLLPVAGLAGLTAIGVLVFSLVNNRRRSQLEEEKDLSLDWSSPGISEPQIPAAPAVSLAKAVPLVKETPPPDESTQPASPPQTEASSLHLEDEGPPSIFSTLDIHTEEADLLSEADIYIAYGRHREARELLEREIQRHPQRIELKYKLADALAASGDRQALQALLDDIQASGGDRKDPAQWERLQRLWREATPTVTAQGLVGQGASAQAPSAVGSEPAPETPVVEKAGRLVDSGLPRSDSPPSAGEGLGLGVPSSQPVPKTEDLLLDDLSQSLGLGASESKPDDALFVDLQIPSSESKPAPAELTSLEDELDQILQKIEAGQTPDLKYPEPEPIPQPTGSSLGIDSVPSPERESVPSDLLSSQWQVDSGIWDEVATKLDLARAYIEMNDKEAAREILEEVLNEGREEQRQEVRELLERLDRPG